MPQGEWVNIKDSVVIKDSVRLRDSIIVIPGSSVEISDRLEFIKEDSLHPADSIIYIKEAHKGNLSASVRITGNGKINVDCKSDSLYQRIQWLEHMLFTIRSSKTERRIAVPGPTVEVVRTPAYVKYYVWFTILLFAWYFRRGLVSAGSYIFSLAKKIIRNG